ncbi:GPI ethanolamine phosphate transferase 2 [Linum grandiflorum]
MLITLCAFHTLVRYSSVYNINTFPRTTLVCCSSGVESFYPPGHPGENGSGIHADLPPHQLKSLYQKLSGMSPMFDRLILMVIDGLPAEFVLGKDGKPPRRDLVEAMPYTHSLLSTGRAFGYHAKAAPPTVTMPRLKAMISGAIGGFLDVAFNFNTQALLDDNLLGQFFKIGWKMVMLGDDTWLKLFPGLFARHDGVNSFYVKDTVQVDFNVSRHLGKELISDDWNLLVLHYLGLDHVGHIGGRSSPLMGPKLTEMDEVVKIIHLNAIQTQVHDHERTLLLVVSDHGMTESGNHGGSSYEETDSLALFIGFESEMTDQASVTSIHQEQVDITPTLALLFNLPVPKNNVGILISETFDSRPEDQRLRALELNSWQLLRLVQAELPAFSCGDSEVLDMSDHVGSTTAECAGSIERSLCCLYTKARSISSFWESTRASRLDSESEYMVAVAAYYDFLNTASEWLSRRVTDRPISLLACGVVAMALSCIILLAILIWMKRKVCTRSQPCTQYVPEFCLQNVFVPSVVLILILSMGSSSMVEEEQYIWHFVTVTSSLLLLRKAWGSLHVGSERGSLTLEQQNQRHSSEVCSIFVLLICGRVLRGWHQGGVNWTHLSDISKWLEKFGSGSIWWIQLVSGLLMISLGLVALCSCWSIGKANHLVALCFSISGLFVLWNIIKYQGNAIASSSYGATTSIQITYATLGFSALSSLLTIPWLMSTGTSYEYSTSFLNLQQSFPIDLKHKALLLEFRDATHVIGLAYILFWCLLQLVLQQPINAMPIFLLMLQVFACMFCNSQVDRDQMEIVEVASLYYMGMAGHFALGNSNTLATIDVAGAFIGLSSHSMIVSGILMFMITYASPLLFLLSSVMYNSVKTTNYLATVRMGDSGQFLKIMLGFPCLVPLTINSILLTSYTVVLLLMRNHLFVWSVFSPKYLYVCATSVCVYTAVLVVAVTETYTFLVLTLRRKPGR